MIKFMLIYIGLGSFCVFSGESGKKIRFLKDDFKNNQNEKLLKKIMEQNKLIKKLLITKKKIKLSVPLVWERKLQIRAGSIISGVIFNNLSVSNADYPVLVNLNSKKLQGRLICRGKNELERIFIDCHTLISKNIEIKVNASILDLDGTLGALGKYYDRYGPYMEDLMLFKSIEGFIHSLKDRIFTPFGEKTKSNLKNATLSGIKGGASVLEEEILKDLSKKRGFTAIKNNTPVLVFFREGIYAN